MNNDLIPNSFVNGVEKKAIIKTIGLTRLVLNLIILYAILDLTHWSISIMGSLDRRLISNHAFYTYRIQPFVAIFLLSLSIIGSSFHLKANRLIELSFEQEDADSFNSGFQFYYKAARLSTLAASISIISVTIRLLLI
jgi:hypothetical protein